MLTAGEILKKKRENLGRSLDTASAETRIQKRFLQYIERNDFSQFDSEIFLTGFLKIYSKYLNLDTEKILALYRRSQPKNISKEKEEKKLFKLKKITITPKLIISLILGIFLIGIFAYIGIQIYKFQSPPPLNIISPTTESITQESQTVVRGQTSPNITVEVNDSPVDTNNEGYFEKTIDLNEGINIITVKARKNNNNILETVETIKITYNKPEQTEEETVPDEPTPNILTIEVTDTASWIKLDIDGENKLSQVIQPSTQEYEVTSEFHIITGRMANTSVFFNDEPIEWNRNSNTGIAEITCTVSGSQLGCE